MERRVRAVWVNMGTPDRPPSQDARIVTDPQAFSTMPGLGPDLCHDRRPDLPHPSYGGGTLVAHGVPSVIISG